MLLSVSDRRLLSVFALVLRSPYRADPLQYNPLARTTPTQRAALTLVHVPYIVTMYIRTEYYACTTRSFFFAGGLCSTVRARDDGR
ncbi:hypothetical protein DAEQUDRAFT_516380 [Daedalea quercina L-15889]|uniref:Uncharacterized protein n=1 Tax=Daedalea quercina L-15889 TaxID=1314783 RepID=A0A165MFT6_9APHY|nr:hypothetical protein DAEQUDRAFT_516380 [Daedalea quercina L-15889]